MLQKQDQKMPTGILSYNVTNRSICNEIKRNARIQVGLYFIPVIPQNDRKC